MSDNVPNFVTPVDAPLRAAVIHEVDQHNVANPGDRIGLAEFVRRAIHESVERRRASRAAGALGEVA